MWYEYEVGGGTIDRYSLSNKKWGWKYLWKLSYPIFGGNRNSGGIRRNPEEFRRNPGQMQEFTGTCENSCKHGRKPEFNYSCQKEVPVKKILRKKKKSWGILRNPGRNEKQGPRNWYSWNRNRQPRLWLCERLVQGSNPRDLLDSSYKMSSW